MSVSSDISVTDVCVSALAINNTRTYEGRRWKILPKFITEIISWKHVVHLLYPCGRHRFYGSRLLHRSSTRSNKMDIKVAHEEASSIHNWSLDKSLLTSIVHGILEKERRIKRSESRARSLLGSREKPAENRSLGLSPQKLWVLHTCIHTNIYSAKIVRTNLRRYRGAGCLSSVDASVITVNFPDTFAVNTYSLCWTLHGCVVSFVCMVFTHVDVKTMMSFRHYFSLSSVNSFNNE